ARSGTRRRKRGAAAQEPPRPLPVPRHRIGPVLQALLLLARRAGPIELSRRLSALVHAVETLALRAEAARAAEDARQAKGTAKGDGGTEADGGRCAGDPSWWAAHLLGEALLRVPDATPYLGVLRLLAERVTARSVAAGGFDSADSRALGGLAEFGPWFWLRLPLGLADRLELLRILIPADSPPPGAAQEAATAALEAGPASEEDDAPATAGTGEVTEAHDATPPEEGADARVPGRPDTGGHRVPGPGHARPETAEQDRPGTGAAGQPEHPTDATPGHAGRQGGVPGQTPGSGDSEDAHGTAPGGPRGSEGVRGSASAAECAGGDGAVPGRTRRNGAAEDGPGEGTGRGSVPGQTRGSAGAPEDAGSASEEWAGADEGAGPRRTRGGGAAGDDSAERAGYGTGPGRARGSDGADEDARGRGAVPGRTRRSGAAEDDAGERAGRGGVPGQTRGSGGARDGAGEGPGGRGTVPGQARGSRGVRGAAGDAVPGRAYGGDGWDEAGGPVGAGPGRGRRGQGDAGGARVPGPARGGGRPSGTAGATDGPQKHVHPADRFLTATSALLIEHTCDAQPLLCRWFTDERALQTMNLGGHVRPTVATVAQALLHTHRRRAIDDLAEALVEAGHPRADELLTALAEDEPSALCRAVDRWAHDDRVERHVAAAAYGLRTAPHVTTEADRELLRFSALALLGRPAEGALHGTALALLVRDADTRAKHLPQALARFSAGDPHLPPDVLAPALTSHPDLVLGAFQARLYEPGERPADVLRTLAEVSSPATLARRIASLVREHVEHRPEGAQNAAAFVHRRLEDGPPARAVIFPLVVDLVRTCPPHVRRALAPVLAGSGTPLSRPLRQELLEVLMEREEYGPYERDVTVLDALLRAVAAGAADRSEARTRDLVHRTGLLMARTPEGAACFDRRLTQLAREVPFFGAQVRGWLKSAPAQWAVVVGPSARIRLTAGREKGGGGGGDDASDASDPAGVTVGSPADAERRQPAWHS
ncbi:hypothetical protein LE181_31400, partial [Streptomyces sp. SCA3-4]|nr:hypothetical protein [Streptomyces sichuanensis]